MGRIKPQALLQQSKRKKGPYHMSPINIVFYTLTLVIFVFFLFATFKYWSNRSVNWMWKLIHSDKWYDICNTFFVSYFLIEWIQKCIICNLIIYNLFCIQDKISTREPHISLWGILWVCFIFSIEIELLE